VIPITFLIAIALGTLLLSLPVAREGGGEVPFVTALFTATSAFCITGLVVVDTSTYWSPFGEAVILGLFQVGGFGIMTGASLWVFWSAGAFASPRGGSCRPKPAASRPADVRSVVYVVLAVTVVVEAVVATILTLRLHFSYGEPWSTAAWHGLFHSVSAFNNAGFALHFRQSDALRP
jgi:Trk-type K+ transport system membrane component